MTHTHEANGKQPLNRYKTPKSSWDHKWSLLGQYLQVPLTIIIVEYSKYITTLAFDFAKQENDQQSVWHAMQHLLSIMRPLAKKGLIEKYKKARLANYNAITILFLTLDHNLFNILYHCTLLLEVLPYHSFWQLFCMKKSKHSSPLV